MDSADESTIELRNPNPAGRLMQMRTCPKRKFGGRRFGLLLWVRYVTDYRTACPLPSQLYALTRPTHRTA